MAYEKKKKGWLWRLLRTLATRLGMKDSINAKLEQISKNAGDAEYEAFRATFDRERAASEISAVIFTVDPSHLFEASMASVKAQSLPPAHIEVIRNVSPFSLASQQALGRVRTPYYVSVDEDMVLHETCFERLYFVMQSNKACAESAANLQDPLIGEIKGVRMYRTDAIRPIGFHPLINEKGCERKMAKELIKRGYETIHCLAVEGIHHPVYLPHEAFWKFRFAAEKARYYDEKMSPEFRDMVDTIVAHWDSSRDDVALYALAGLHSEDLERELNYEGRLEDPMFLKTQKFLTRKKESGGT